MPSRRFVASTILITALVSYVSLFPGMKTWLKANLPYSAMGAKGKAAYSHHAAAMSEMRSVSKNPATLHKYYKLDARQLPESIRGRIHELNFDQESQAFVDSCRPSFLLSLLAKILRLFYSVTDVNGILGRGQMFVLSTAQYRDVLLGPILEGVQQARRSSDAGDDDDDEARKLTLLDVGAGDGDVTARLAPLFNGRISVTEVSVPMARRLAARGYDTHVTPFLTEEAFPGNVTYDVVSIHNVLDRCDHPKELLKGAIRLLRPGTGRLLLAVVLPLCEFVEDGTARRPPNGPLPLEGARCRDGASFEQSLSALITRVLWPLGLTVEKISKVPYLCRGDLMRPYYVLPDAILVCKVAEEGEQEAGSPSGAAAVPSTSSASMGASRRPATKTALQPGAGGVYSLDAGGEQEPLMAMGAS